MPTYNLGPCECCGDYPEGSVCYWDGDESFQCVAPDEDPPQGWTPTDKACPGHCCCHWFQPATCSGTSANAPCDVVPPQSFDFQIRIANSFTSGGFKECGDNATAYMNAVPELPPITYSFTGSSGGIANYQGAASGNGWTLQTPSNVTATVGICSGNIRLQEIYWQRDNGLVTLRVFLWYLPPYYIDIGSSIVYPSTVCDGGPSYTAGILDGIAILDASLVTPCDDGVGPNNPTYHTNPAATYDAPSLTFQTLPPQSPPVCFAQAEVDCGVCCDSDGGCTAGIDGGLQSQTACADAGGTWIWNGECSDCAFLSNPLP